jgi:uncharacterized membrane protein
MTRQEYLSAIRKELSSLSESEVNDIVRDFDEHFEVGLSQGKTEHEISAELGDPVQVARTYFDDLEDVGHTMKESEEAAANGSAAANASAAAGQTAPVVIPAGSNSNANASTAGSAAPAAPVQKDVSGARLFVVLFNILLTWWVFLTIVGMLIGFWAASIALLAAGIAAFIGIVAAAGGWIAVLVLLGISGVTLGIGTGIINYFMTKWFVIGCKAYVKWNIKLYNEGF